MSDRKRFALSSVDLNLLKVLFVLAQKGNMTQAGDFVGLSQPAMSHALKRLRALTGDKLFVRTATGFAMTSFCAEIYPTVKRIIEERRKPSSCHGASSIRRARGVPSASA